MKIHDALKKMGSMEDVAMFRWVAGSRRIAKHYVPLSEIRLNVLTCDQGRIIYSSAAPVLYMERGRSVIRFLDRGLLTINEGDRKDINILPAFLRSEEEATETRFCGYNNVADTECPKWLELRILEMIDEEERYMALHIVMPDLYRISRVAENFKPVFNKELKSKIGAAQQDSLEVLKRKFLENINRIGYNTDDGYVISNDLIASGGCCVAETRWCRGDDRSAVHMMPMSEFIKDIESHKWSIETAKEVLNAVENVTGRPD